MKMISATMNESFLSGFYVGSKNVGGLNICHFLFTIDNRCFVGQT
jgi:hypothetical protein